MNRLLVCLVFALTTIGFSQAPIAVNSMDIEKDGANVVTITPTSEVTFHSQGIDLSMNNGDAFRFHFNHKRMGNKPVVRTHSGVTEVWYPRLYKDITLRCFVKADGEIGYDWKMGPTAHASQVQMTMERRLAGQSAYLPNTFVAVR